MARPPDNGTRSDGRRELVATADARTGMFVAELDRPWEGTPFLLQGFVIENEEELAQLRTLCRFIYIDRSRSLGEHYSPPGTGEVRSERSRPASTHAAVQEADDAAHPGFLEVLALLRAGKIDKTAAQRLPARSSPDRPGAHPVERELLIAAPAFDRAEQIFTQVLADVAESRKPDIGQVVYAVDELSASVRRNPDALLWLLRLKRYDRYSYQHALEVAVHMIIFAHSLGFTGESATVLGVAGMMQDIGKIRLPERVLRKAGKLSRMEMEIAKAHVEFSTQIIMQEQQPLPGLIEIVNRHHERIDGSGYPKGLRGAEIGLQGEMAGIVDSYCAMTSKRTYDEALSTQRALESLHLQRAVKFSAPVVDGFIQCIGLYPAGTLVELNSGEVAVVISQNRVRRMQPRVLVLLCADKTPNRHPPTLDLLYAPLTPAGEPYRIIRALPAGAFGIDPSEFYLS